MTEFIVPDEPTTFKLMELSGKMEAEPLLMVTNLLAYEHSTGPMVPLNHI